MFSHPSVLASACEFHTFWNFFFSVFYSYEMFLFPQKALLFCKVGILVFHFNVAVLPDHDSVTVFGRHNQWGTPDDN